MKFRRCSWSVLWFTKAFWVWRVSTRSKLFVPWGLCRQREIKHRGHLLTTMLQN